MPKRLARFGLFACMLVLLLAVPAFGQEDEKKWSEVPVIETERPWVQWLAGVLLAGGCVAIGFKNPHRTHLD